MAVCESFVNGEVCTHHLEVVCSLIPCVDGEVHIHRLEVMRSLVPFAQGQLVVFPAPVQSVWMQFKAGPSR